MTFYQKFKKETIPPIEIEGFYRLGIFVMIDELIAVVNVNEPVEITPVQVPAEPTKVESQAHKDWAAAKKAFMDNYTNGQEPNADMKAIMIASIGEEPPFE